MKAIHVFSLLLAAITPAAAGAETLLIETEGVTYAIPADLAGEMIFSAGTELEILGKKYQFSEVSEINVTDTDFEAGNVTITYSANKAHVTVPGQIARYLSVSVSGAHVTIDQSAEVGDATCGEITYTLSGESSDASFYTTGSYKATVVLNGVKITNPESAAFNIQNGKRIKLKINENTENTLTDGASGSQKGCITCKGHLEIAGKGTLTVTGNANHAIFAKEYLTLKNATIKVTKSVKDGVNCNQYFAMESGSIELNGIGDDGIQVSYKDETNREADDTGCATISGGTITATVTAGGKWDSSELKTKAASCLKADGDVIISGATLDLKATGSGGKGIKTDGAFTLTAGSVTVATTGGLFAYTNGKEYDNYTGSTDRLSSNYKSSPKGIKADGIITIDGGNLSVTTTGNGGEGVESKSTLTISGGTVFVKAYDDGINSSSHMYLKGGNITSIGTNNDGIDSNGNLYISGGTIMAFGASSPECGLDANEEGGYSVIFTGGNILGVGGSNSTPSSSASTQAYLSVNSSLKAGDTVTVKSDDTVLVTFTVTDSYSGSSSGGPGGGGWMMAGPGGWGGGPGGSSGGGVLISCPGLVSGQSYSVTAGSSTTTASAVQSGGGSNRPW